METNQIESAVPRPKKEVRKIQESVYVWPSTWAAVSAATKKYGQGNNSRTAEKAILIGLRAIAENPSLLLGSLSPEDENV